MTINYQFTLALKALREVQAELGQEPAAGQPLFPGLDHVLDEIGALPPDQVPLGIASDGLPVLLNLRDAAPGPLLILADQGSGKTLFLQVLARAAMRLLPPEKIRYAALTGFPDEWRDFESGPQNLGVFPVRDDPTSELLYNLACQAEAGRTKRFTLLLFDGFDSALDLEPADQQNLLYLLGRGPQAGIWSVVSINAARAAKVQQWLSFFHTRIYGRISDPGTAAELTGQTGSGLNTLFPGAQFCLRQRTHWLRFWLPGL